MADDNPRIFEGANGPPAEAANPFDTVALHINDLLTEARNWADGVIVENQDQADAVSRLISDLREAGDAADDLRLEEKKPLDEQIEEIQTRFNAYIGGLKSKVKNPGKVVVAIDALKATLKPFLDKLEAARLAEAARVRAEADEAARVAAEAARAAAPEDLSAREAAEDLVASAARQAAEAKRLENSRSHANGGNRAMGLTKTYTPEITSAREAILHYIATRPEDVKAFLLDMAKADVREGKRSIPGFNIAEGTRL